MQIQHHWLLHWLMFGMLVLAVPVAAQPETTRAYAGETVRYDYAQVLRADPVYESVLVSEPYQECEEASEYRRVGPERASNGSVGGTVVGAVIGGVLGNQVGKGDGRTAATVGGAVIGGAIGNRVGAGASAGGYRGQIVQPACRTVVNQREERRIVGYDVEYRYRGDVFLSRLAYDPGTQLRVRVAVAPVDEPR